jgi:hypothetical protein
MRREGYNNFWHNQGQSHKEVLKNNQTAQSGKSRFLMPARSVSFSYRCANPHRRFMAVGVCCSILAKNHHKSQFVLRKLSKKKRDLKQLQNTVQAMKLPSI